MTVVSGNSGLGLQTLVDRQPLTNVQISIDFAISFPLKPSRVGFYYLFLSAKTTPFTSELVVQGALYRPGQRILVPSAVALANFNWSVLVYWNINNLAYSLTYV